MASNLQPWENVYVFISSTFNDMHAERDYLVKRVFPELSEWCEERRLRLVDIDLRWGVTEKDSQENKRVVDVCLTNIDRCRPLFLCFLGQRRGWVPDADDIAATTFENFPKLANHLGSSVTEMEIIHALIDPMMNGQVMELSNRERAFFFLRDSGYLEDITDQNVRNIYTNETEPDPAWTDEKLVAFRERIRRTGRPALDYTAHWDSAASTPELLMPGKPEGIDRGRLTSFECDGRELSEVIIEQMKEAIEELYPSREKTTDATSLNHELDEQARFLHFAQEGFIERTGDFDAIEAFIESKDSRPCAVVAPAGMGKTSFLARLISRLQDGGVRDVMYRFVGTSEESVSQASLLLSLAAELRDRFGVQRIPATPQKVKESLSGLLEKAVEKTGKPLVVLVDAINQLDTALDDLSWIPIQLTEGVKFIYSFKLDEPAGDALLKTLEEEGETCVLKLRGFEDATDREKLVTQFLQLYLKELDEHNIEDIISQPGAENPLFMKVLLSELRVYGSHEGLHDRIVSQFGKTPQEAFDGLLDRLETDPMYSSVPPSTLAAHLFGWLAHSKNGLEPGELAGLLVANGLASTDADARDSVNLMLRQLRAYLAKRDKRQDFFYESFLLAARERYTMPERGGKPAFEWHADLARYFEGLPETDSRRTAELAYQYAHAGMGESLVSLLTSFPFLERRIRQGGMRGALEDYALADLPQAGIASDDRAQLGLIREALEMAAPMVGKSLTQLAGQLFGRLMAFDASRIQTLLASADHTLSARKEPWLKPLCTFLPQPGSRIKRYYKKSHGSSAHLFRDGSRLIVSCTDDRTVRIVEIDSGRTLRSFPLRDDPQWICLCEDENVLAVREMRKLYFLNLATGQTYDAEGVKGANGARFAAHDGMLVCTGSEVGKNEKTAYVSDVRTGALLHTLTFGSGSAEKGFPNTFSVAFDTETGLLVMSTEEAGFTAYDLRKGFQPVRQYRNPAYERNISWKSSNCWLFSGTPYLVTATEYDELTIYDKFTGDVLCHQRIFNANGTRVAISPDNTMLAFSYFSTVKLISLESYEVVGQFDAGNSKNETYALEFSPDGESLYLGRSGGEIQVWDLASHEKVNEYDEAKDMVQELHLGTSGDTMVAFHDSQVIVWDHSREGRRPAAPIFELQALSTALAPDGSFIIATTRASDGAIYRIDVPSMACRRIVESNQSFHSRDNVTINCDGKYFGVTERQNEFKVFDCETGEPAGEFLAVDALGTNDVNSQRISRPQFLPASLSLGPRNLTVIYHQYGFLVMQDPDAPGAERVIDAFPGSVQWQRLFKGNTKLAVVSGTRVFVGGGGRLTSRDDPSIEERAYIFDLASGACIEETDDWAHVYVESLELDGYPDFAEYNAGLWQNKYSSKKSIGSSIKIICRQEGRVVYEWESNYLRGIIEKSREHALIIWDSTRRDAGPLCWHASDETAALQDKQFSYDGRYAFMRARNTLHAFSLENILDMEPAKPVRSEKELDHLGFELSHKEDSESQYEAYLVYSELVERFPENEHHKKNRGIVERKLKMALDTLGKEDDNVAIERWYATFRSLSEAHPNDEGFASMHGYAEDKLAFVLSSRDDLLAKKRSIELYEDLVGRSYSPERNVNNLRIMRSQVADLYRAKGKEQYDLESAKKAYEMYGKLADEYPDRGQYRKNQYSTEHNLAYIHLKVGLEGNIGHLRESRELYRKILLREPENSAVKKNVDILEKKLAFLLSKEKDAESLRESLELYAMLAKRYPDDTLWENNRGIVERQLGRLG